MPAPDQWTGRMQNAPRLLDERRKVVRQFVGKLKRSNAASSSRRKPALQRAATDGEVDHRDDLLPVLGLGERPCPDH